MSSRFEEKDDPTMPPPYSGPSSSCDARPFNKVWERAAINNATTGQAAAKELLDDMKFPDMLDVIRDYIEMREDLDPDALMNFSNLLGRKAWSKI